MHLSSIMQNENNAPSGETLSAHATIFGEFEEMRRIQSVRWMKGFFHKYLYLSTVQIFVHLKYTYKITHQIVQIYSEELGDDSSLDFKNMHLDAPFKT